MAFDSQDPQECLDKTLAWAEGKYPPEQIQAAMPLLRAYQWQCLEVLLTTHESGEGHHARSRAKIEKLIGDIDFDLGEDGSEPK